MKNDVICIARYNTNNGGEETRNEKIGIGSTFYFWLTLIYDGDGEIFEIVARQTAAMIYIHHCSYE